MADRPQKPSQSAFDGVDLTGWRPLRDGTIWHGCEVYYRVTSTADVISISYDDGIYMAGINWGVFSEGADLGALMDDVRRVAAMNDGWDDV